MEGLPVRIDPWLRLSYFVYGQGQVGLDLFLGRTWLHVTDEIQCVPLRPNDVVLNGRIEINLHRRKEYRRKGICGRHDAHDLSGSTVNLYGPADYSGVSPESANPERVGKDDTKGGILQSIFRKEEAPILWLHSQQPKKSVRDAYS